MDRFAPRYHQDLRDIQDEVDTLMMSKFLHPQDVMEELDRRMILSNALGPTRSWVNKYHAIRLAQFAGMTNRLTHRSGDEEAAQNWPAAVRAIIAQEDADRRYNKYLKHARRKLLTVLLVEKAEQLPRIEQSRHFVPWRHNAAGEIEIDDSPQRQLPEPWQGWRQGWRQGRG